MHAPAGAMLRLGAAPRTVRVPTTARVVFSRPAASQQALRRCFRSRSVRTSTVCSAKSSDEQASASLGGGDGVPPGGGSGGGDGLPEQPSEPEDDDDTEPLLTAAQVRV